MKSDSNRRYKLDSNILTQLHPHLNNQSITKKKGYQNKSKDIEKSAEQSVQFERLNDMHESEISKDSAISIDCKENIVLPSNQSNIIPIESNKNCNNLIDPIRDIDTNKRSSKVKPKKVVIKPNIDPKLEKITDDPRIDKNLGVKVIIQKESGRNSESFDPSTTLIRPDMRIRVVTNLQPSSSESNSESKKVVDYIPGNKLSHDDVVVIPNFFCNENDWSIYYQLIEELRSIQSNRKNSSSDWVSWHEGTHLITKNPKQSPTYNMIIKKIASFYNIPLISVGTRFNWYVDSTDWKPFHHDSAAYNKDRAKNQNITVGVSFGATRELAFLHANNNTKIDFPQSNGMVFSFGRDVNIRWKHGINALPENSEDKRGRISIILWGQCPNIPEEANSPSMLLDNTSGYGHDVHNVGNSENKRADSSTVDYVSTINHSIENIKKIEKCIHFVRGKCKYGENCRFSH